MFCHKCGCSLPASVKFCNKCGAAQSRNQSTETTNTAVPSEQTASPSPAMAMSAREPQMSAHSQPLPYAPQNVPDSYAQPVSNSGSILRTVVGIILGIAVLYFAVTVVVPSLTGEVGLTETLESAINQPHVLAQQTEQEQPLETAQRAEQEDSLRNAMTETVFATDELDNLRQERAALFALVDPPPVGPFPVGRWFRTHRTNVGWFQYENTNEYTMHEFHDDNTVRTYQGCWERGAREFLYERTWDIYSRITGSGRFISQQYIIRVTHADGTIQRFRFNTSGTRTRGLDSLTHVDESYDFVDLSPYVFNLPTPGTLYEQLAGLPMFTISGNWYRSDTIWPPPRDSIRFHVNYLLEGNGVLQVFYEVRENPERTTTTGEWSRVGFWRISEGRVYMHFYDGSIISYTLQNGELHSANTVLQREINHCIEHQRAIAADDARREALIRETKNRFLGQWHWDIALMFFNEDGTGFLEVPGLAGNPHQNLHFTFEVWPPTANHDAMLIINYTDEWPNLLAGQSRIYWVRFGTRRGGSMEFIGPEDEVAFFMTRTFDSGNTPFIDDLFEDIGRFMNLIGKLAP